jgi:hypothetical protein
MSTGGFRERNIEIKTSPIRIVSDMYFHRQMQMTRIHIIANIQYSNQRSRNILWVESMVWKYGKYALTVILLSWEKNRIIHHGHIQNKKTDIYWTISFHISFMRINLDRRDKSLSEAFSTITEYNVNELAMIPMEIGIYFRQNSNVINRGKHMEKSIPPI